MLQSTTLSKVYGHGHIKKFWLMQNQKETENKTVLASSTSRNNGSSQGLGHESKQGSQFSVGNTSARTLTTPPGVPVRPLISGPACFNMARHTSLVTCAESLSPPSLMEQSQSLVRPSSPNTAASDEKCSSAVDGSGMSLKSRCGQGASPAYIPQWASSFGFGNLLNRSPLLSKEQNIDAVIDGISQSKDSQLNTSPLQHVKTADDTASNKESSRPSNRGLRVFPELEAVTPFAAPFHLPEKYLSETEANTFDGEAARKIDPNNEALYTVHTIKRAIPSISKCGAGRGEPFEVAGGETRRDGVCGTILRTCSVCGTSKTPLWRSGPKGPKSLCNACGIRFKKARRGSSDSTDRPAASSLASPYAKSVLKAAKRKQDVPITSVDTHVSKSLITNGIPTQVVKKRRGSQVTRKGENAAQNGEVTGSSNENSLTWNLHSPSAVSSPSVSHFERLSINEDSTEAGKDEEEAALLLMYMSWGLVFA